MVANLAAVLAAAACALRPGTPSPRSKQLTALRDIAKVKATLTRCQAACLPGPAASAFASVSELSKTLAEETSALSADLRAFEAGSLPAAPAAPAPVWPRWTSTSTPGQFEPSARFERELNVMRIKASGLHAQVDMQREQLALLEEAEVSAETRTQQVFDAIDTNGDGSICLTEFTEAASTLLAASFTLSGPQLNAELKSRFERADSNGDGTLCFDEFSRFLGSLRGESLGPLRTARATGLSELLDTTLEMTCLSLARELTAASTEGSRAAELSAYVDRWCALEAARGRCAPVAADGGAADVEGAAQLEALLLEVGGLAAGLALTNVTATVEWSLRRSVRMLVGGAKASLSFCARGLAITWGDVVEAARLFRRMFGGQSLVPQDVSLIKRTLFDIVMLVPYAIIMIIPLSPPGHVFAFSVLNRVFPGAVPSGFTAQRQDINELYARIAAEASDRDMLSPAMRLRRPALRRAGRAVGRSAKRLLRGSVPGLA